MSEADLWAPDRATLHGFGVATSGELARSIGDVDARLAEFDPYAPRPDIRFGRPRTSARSLYRELYAVPACEARDWG